MVFDPFEIVGAVADPFVAAGLLHAEQHRNRQEAVDAVLSKLDDINVFRSRARGGERLNPARLAASQRSLALLLRRARVDGTHPRIDGTSWPAPWVAEFAAIIPQLETDSPDPASYDEGYILNLLAQALRAWRPKPSDAEADRIVGILRANAERAAAPKDDGPRS